MLDELIAEFDSALRTVFAPAATGRSCPGAQLAETVHDTAQRRHAAALMRVNHSGEVCAQALYRGQALASSDAHIKAALAQAASEQTEHLNWTERRIAELGGRQSLLNPLWYAGALVIGTAAGKCGDRWNLGFLAETERQVERHLRGHLERLPEDDAKSSAIVGQMVADEAKHARTAVALGANELPAAVKLAMRLAAKLMTTTAYRI